MSEASGTSRLAATREALARQQEYLALLQAVAVAANEADRLEAVVDEVCSMICENMQWSCGHAWRVDPEHGHCVSGGTWYPASDPAIGRLQQATKHHVFAPGEGLVGRALAERRAVWISDDLADHSDFLRRDLARELDLRAFVAFPVLAGDRSVAIFEFFSRQPIHPTETLLELMVHIGTTVGRVAEREEASRQTYLLLRTELAREQAEERAAEFEALAQDLERSNAELDQFAYVASHDLRSPLRGIANLADWIERDLEPHLDEKTRRYLELLQSRVARMDQFIEGLLAYSRVGRTRTGSAELDVGELVVNAWAMAAVPGHAELVATGLPTIEGERAPLEQVLHNLITNALKYGGADARVEVRAVREREGYWRFEVEDDGPGIEAQYHGRIWQMFQTLKPRDEVEGTGIGLALVKKTVERHGGEVGLRSEPGRGACFTFTWPERALE